MKYIPLGPGSPASVADRGIGFMHEKVNSYLFHFSSRASL